MASPVSHPGCFLLVFCLLAVAVLSFPLQSCSVIDFGAKGDNQTEDTTAIQKALNSCQTVTFPAPGKYLTRSLSISQSNQDIVLQSGATLVSWSDPNTYNLTSSVRALLWYSSMSSANVTLTGGGTIDGQGWRWWPFMKTRPRPSLLSMDHGLGVLIDNITFINSPSFHIAVRGEHIEIAHVTILANVDSCGGYGSAPNTDGINIGGVDIHVHDCYIHNGDDCIPTNVGPDNTDSRDILVERVSCHCGTNGGVLIIAAQNSIHNVTFRDMLVNGTNQGAGMKISEPYSNATGTFYEAVWDNITITNPRFAATYLNVYQEDAEVCTLPPNPDRGYWLSGHNLTFSNINAFVGDRALAGCFLCSPDSPCEGINWVNVTVQSNNQSAVRLYTCANVMPGDVTGSVPAPCPPSTTRLM